METLGQKLRKAREQKGWSAEEAASRLKIHVKYFHAIESDDTASLPGSSFYRSFVRQYASLVGLPESAYAGELDSAAQSHLAEITREQPDSVPRLDYQVPPMPTAVSDPGEETKRWALRLVLLVLVMGLSSGGYVLWQRWKAFSEEQAAAAQKQAQQQATQTVQQPVQQTAPPPAPVSSEPAATQDPALSTTPGQDSAGQLTPGQSTQAQTSQTQTSQAATTPVQPAPTVPATPPAAEPAKGPIQVTLTAKEPVWVDVWVEGKRVHSNVLAPGQAKSFAASQMLRVRYGNAGGVDVLWNGKGTETPGPRGQIRTWEYLPGSYRMVPVAPKAGPDVVQPPAPQ